MRCRTEADGKGHALVVLVALVVLAIGTVLIPGCRLAPTGDESFAPLFLRHLETGRVLQANPWDVNPVREASLDGTRVVYTGFRHGALNVHLYELKRDRGG